MNMQGFTELEKQFIKEFISPDVVMLEFGGGGSTLEFGKVCKRYYSIEGDRLWFEMVRRETAELPNVHLYFVPHGVAHTDSYDPVSYAEFSMNLNERFDVVLIDGADRALCGECIHDTLDEKCAVFVHDWDRMHVSRFLRIYNVERVIDNLALLRKI